jgi:hypothetical protein
MAKWFAVVTLGERQQWQQGGFETRAAALKAASVYASKHKKKATGFRAEKE